LVESVQRLCALLAFNFQTQAVRIGHEHGTGDWESRFDVFVELLEHKILASLQNREADRVGLV